MDNKQKLQSEIKTYIFYREDGFYPIDLPKDTLQDNIDCNEGTLKVTDIYGEVLWEKEV